MSDMSVGDAFEAALDTSIPDEAILTLPSASVLFTTTFNSDMNFYL
jgi:hypothetical protein